MRILPLFLLCLVISSVAEARCKGKDLLRRADPAFLSQLQKATARHPFSKGRYWEISKNGKTSWIIGTIHIDDGRTKEVPRFFVKKIRKARLLQKEITSSLGYEIRLAAEDLKEKSNAKKRPPVRDYFTKAEWKLIARFADKKGIREKELLKYSPESIRNIVSSPPCAAKRDYYLDKKVELAARKVNVPVQPLDTIAIRLNVSYKTHFNDNYFVTMTKAELPLLKHSENDRETAVQLYRKDETMMIWEYQLARARQVMPESIIKKMHRESYGMLITDRNRLWMPKILPQVAKGNVVIAVGALHLPGKHGLIYLLQQRGYSVKRLDL